LLHRIHRPALRFQFSGQKYRAERERQGLSREQLAVQLGRSVSLVTQLDRGYHQPSLDKAARFAAALGRRVDDFLDEVSE
jgi:transcriptional regulator with XRE-family HTH domain